MSTGLQMLARLEAEMVACGEEIDRLKAIAREAIQIAYGGDLSIAAYERLRDLMNLVDNPPGGGVIRYHGAPCWPTNAAIALFRARHAMCSFAHPEQIGLIAELCQSFVLDCGAFSHWRAGKGVVDVKAYAAWIQEWDRHPGFDWCLIPDVIDGTEFDNDKMLASWFAAGMRHGVPVWHLHESLDRLKYLCVCYPRVALGSSGQWATPGTPDWWQRMDEVREAVTDEKRRPIVKLHGLRMLNPTIFAHVPLASADSCNVALNIGKDVKWSGTYQPLTEATRALVLAERIEQHACAVTWSRRAGVQQNLELIG